ncbi:hypothetical protein V865_006296 [Kwoniella europaea PYCC6329]|uniref:Uncharacterized protein n=1 Tax=Kwoniella europaea PYCC6329 TaxID=1423913 RepID=A0AAX4KRJ4_9TREE
MSSDAVSHQNSQSSSSPSPSTQESSKLGLIGHWITHESTRGHVYIVDKWFDFDRYDPQIVTENIFRMNEESEGLILTAELERIRSFPNLTEDQLDDKDCETAEKLRSACQTINSDSSKVFYHQVFHRDKIGFPLYRTFLRTTNPAIDPLGNVLRPERFGSRTALVSTYNDRTNDEIKRRYDPDFNPTSVSDTKDE